MQGDNLGDSPPILDWHYSVAGERFGPASQDQVAALIRNNRIPADSVVWNQTFPDWIPIMKTQFAPLFTHDASIPPPLTGEAVKNTLVWVLAFAPVIGVFLEGLVSEITGIAPDYLWFITLSLNIVLSYQDSILLKKAGHDTRKMGVVFLIPVYLFKRATILKQSNAYFIVWCVTFTLMLFGLL